MAVELVLVLSLRALALLVGLLALLTVLLLLEIFLGLLGEQIGCLLLILALHIAVDCHQGLFQDLQILPLQILSSLLVYHLHEQRNHLVARLALKSLNHLLNLAELILALVLLLLIGHLPALCARSGFFGGGLGLLIVDVASLLHPHDDFLRLSLFHGLLDHASELLVEIILLYDFQDKVMVIIT